MKQKNKEKKVKVKKEKQKKSKLSIFLIVIDVIALICFFLAYGPISYFRDLLVTTAMTTMTHRYFAYVLYSEEQVDKILDNNRIIESNESTDTSAINFNPDFGSDSYESIYEEQILKKDEGNEIYKVIDLKGDSWKGYMVVIYDPANVQLVFSSSYGKGGDFLSDMAKEKNALIAMNASGVKTSVGKNPVTGTAILNGKVYAKGKNINKGGGLIGFTKDNVLMLTKKSAKEAIADGMDRAVEFGPFLIVNGKASTFKGNGGWGIANRSAIGQRQDGIVLFVVIDGRQSGSVGISMPDLVELFQKYKAYNAANLDGGGSSSLYAKRTLTSKGELINNPVGYGYSGQRRLPNAWMVLPSAIEREEEKKKAQDDEKTEENTESKIENSTENKEN